MAANVGVGEAGVAERRRSGIASVALAVDRDAEVVLGERANRREHALDAEAEQELIDAVDAETEALDARDAAVRAGRDRAPAMLRRVRSWLDELSNR